MKGKTSKKSVTSQAEKKARVRDRAKYRCPDEVKKMIDLVNSIPPDRHLPHFQDVLVDIGTDRRVEIRRRLKELLDGVPKEFFTSRGRIAAAYIEFRMIRMVLRGLANLALVPLADRRFYMAVEHHMVEQPSDEFRERFKNVKLHHWKDYGRSDFNFGYIPFQPSYSVDLTIGDGGLIEKRPSSQMDALVGVIADRLRVCDFCEQIFWARQDNMVACNPRCSNANRQRLKRERDAQYEASREKKRNARAKAGKGAK